MDARASLLLIAAVIAPAVASAAPKSAAKHAAAKEPPLPPPAVTLTLDAPSPHGAWKMRVENTGDVPLRLVADARLLSLEVTAPGAKKPVTCALPADMRPTNDVDRAIVLAPKRAYSESFDPRLYCFGARASEALLAGASVVARLGFAASRAAAPPYVISPFEGVGPVVRAERAIVAPSAAIRAGDTEPLVAAPPPPLPKAGDDAYPTKLEVASAKHVDVEAPHDVPITVTLKNDGVRPVTVLLRPETLAFDVIGPKSTEHCAWPTQVGGSVREAYTTLRAKGSAEVSVLLDALCPGSTFDQPGLYVVRPRLDTRHAGGEAVGLSAFAGEVIGTKATLLRVHRGAKPPPRARPSLDPL